MKKLLFILVAVVAAVSAQAAYVDWQYSVTESKSGTDWTSGGYTAYFLTATAWDGIKDNVTAEALEGAKTDKSGFFLASSGKSSKVYSTGGSAAGVRQVEAASGDYYVILGSATGYTVGLGPASITAYADGSGVGTGLTPGTTIEPSSAATGSTLTTAMASTPYSSGGGGVPEPTSGLLLALGGAMLALRRRRA